MAADQYLLDTAVNCLRLLRIMADMRPSGRSLSGITTLVSQPDASGWSLTPYQARCCLATLEAEGYLATYDVGGETFYTVGPQMAAITHLFFARQRDALEEVICQAKAALGELPGRSR